MDREGIVNHAINEFERAKKFGMPHNMWVPFKQAFYKAYELGKNQGVEVCRDFIEECVYDIYEDDMQKNIEDLVDKYYGSKILDSDYHYLKEGMLLVRSLAHKALDRQIIGIDFNKFTDCCRCGERGNKYKANLCKECYDIVIKRNQGLIENEERTN